MSFPNLHPVVVHFPIALLALAMAVDAAALAFARWSWLDRAATCLWVLGAAGAGVAYLTGRQAGDEAGVLSPAAEDALSRHSDLAWWTLLGAGAVAALRLATWWLARTDDTTLRRTLRVAQLVLGPGTVGLVLVTADRGGVLVYRHGVNVAALTRAAPTDAAPIVAVPADDGWRGRLVRMEGGGAVWTPQAGDAPALGEIVEVIAEPAGAITPLVAAGEGLPLSIDGRVFILLPGESGDVQVRAVLGLAEFPGTVGVLHHYRGPASCGSFELAGSARRLVSRQGGEPKVLDEAVGDPAPDRVTLVVSAAGSHLKGFVGGKLAVHGHMGAPAPGRTGLLLEGRGTVRIFELRRDVLLEP